MPILKGNEIDYNLDLVQLTKVAYENTIEAYLQQHSLPEEMKQQADRFLELLGGKSVLDAGCGPGRDCEYFAYKGCTLTCLDIVPEFIWITKKKVPSAYVRVGDMQDMPFEDNKFDGIWNCAALMHLFDTNKAMAEHNRVLKNKGLLYVSVINKPEDSLIIDEKYGGGAKFFKGYTEDSLAELLENNGFKILEQFGNSAINYRGELKFLNVYARKI